MRALVTGAGGFIGSHLMTALAASGREAVGVIRATDQRITSALSPSRLVTGDVTNGAWLKELLGSQHIDVVFHLAGRDAFADPVELYQMNVVGTAALLEAVRRLGRPELKVVLLGSSAQYGVTGNDPVIEECGFNPITNYGISKVACEAMGRLLFEQTGQQVLCARAFNIIGPGQSPRLLQGSVIEQIVAIEEGKRPALVEVGDLSAYRDFLDVRDAAMGLIAVAEHGVAGDAYNICSGEAVQVSKLVACLVGLARVTIEVKSHERLSIANLPYQLGSCAKLKKRAGWEPTIPFDKSLEEALNERRLGARPAIVGDQLQ